MTMHKVTAETECCQALYVRELAHRTANVLQRAIAAVHMSRRGNPDHLDDAMDCLSGAAELHSILSEQGVGPVDLGDRVKLVAIMTGQACGATAAIQLVFDADTLVVSSEAARRVAMIVSELVGNSIKHAFPGEVGSILVVIRDDGRHTGVMVEDEGVGEGWSRPGGQGHGIVDGLARSLGGEARRRRLPSGGARVEILMPSLAIVSGQPAGSA